MRMRSEAPGSGTSVAEVTNISRHGFWVFLGDREIFLSFEDYPWFHDAPVGAILKVKRPQPYHLYWPDLDVDLSLDSIENPDRYPLKSKERLARECATLDPDEEKAVAEGSGEAES